MSDLPPNIDAILASIRARMNEEGAPLPPEPLPPEPAPVIVPEPAPVADIGPVTLAGSEQTIDALLRSMLEPLIMRWLDANMPEIVSTLAQGEIKRLTGKD